MTISGAIVGEVYPARRHSMRGSSNNAALDERGGDRHAAFSLTDAVQPSPRTTRILIINDDRSLREELADYLGEHSVNASCVAAEQDLLHALSRLRPDIVLLDVPVQERNSFRLLRELRSRSDVPVIVTASHARDEVDGIVALELGADDYLARPFSLRELLARIRATLRRCEMARNASRRPPEHGGFRFAGWQLHRRSRRLTAPNGETVPITKGEYALLIAFLSAPQRPLSREQLLLATRVNDDVFDRSIDVQVLRLRRKLDVDPGTVQFIQTERGVGYVFAVPVEAY